MAILEVSDNFINEYPVDWMLVQSALLSIRELQPIHFGVRRFSIIADGLPYDDTNVLAKITIEDGCYKIEID